MQIASNSLFGVAESGNDFTKFSTIYQWFQTLIHPALMQPPSPMSIVICHYFCQNVSDIFFVLAWFQLSSDRIYIDGSDIFVGQLCTPDYLLDFDGESLLLLRLK
ncbi:MAG: hypothetical protein HRU34_13410 [Richelia sp.]|nr:hypothetical protein [Richelia sp.]